MAVVVDSSVLIELERRDISPRAAQVFVLNEPTWISSVTVSELLVGVHRANTEARRQRRAAYVEAVIQAIPVADFSLDAARIYARLGVELGLSGKSIGAHDLMIAATALALNCHVLTANLRHFGIVPKLEVRQPSW